MSRPLQRVVVLGAGTMGARLAAHCVNCGLHTTLLDLNREAAQAGVQAASKSRPAAFFLPELAQHIHVGSFDSDGGAIGRADWVIEAIVEDLRAKRALLARVAPQLASHAILSTNTSGLLVREVGAELPAAVQGRWLGTHFFNPPRYMRLVEVIDGAATDAERKAWLLRTLEVRLGKGVVRARDTPNFIANRIGLFALLNVLRLMEEMRLSVEEVDALTGPVMGLPKSATFRTLDLIGVDTLARVIENSYQNLAGDERREIFKVPGFVQAMVERGWLGEKTGQGFYQRRGDEILALDLSTLTYHPRRKASVPFDRLQAAYAQSPLVRQHLQDLFAYAQARVGEISDAPDDIDRAMRWGYNWRWGPFELQQMIESGRAPERALGKRVRHNPGCSLLELGGGIGCLEFHTKMNAIGGDTVAMVTETLADSDSAWDGFVISNGAENFSVGADLLYLLAIIRDEEWDEVEAAVRHFQAMTLAIKRSPRPVVVAPFGLTLGGGCEVMLHGARVVAHAELYAGLVEVGVGLIPAGGGTKEMALRLDAKTAFETIAMARVSKSGAEAKALGFLRHGDGMIANRERVLEVAQRTARDLADAGYAPAAEAHLSAPGPSVEATLRLGAYLMREAEQITEYERGIADRLAHVICGGGAPAGMAVSEERLLELEREAFLSLCGEAKTQERMAHMLKTGKALRN